MFVDSSVWFAAVNEKDRQHHRSKALLIDQKGLVTSSLVLAETWRLLWQKVHWAAAESFWHVIRQGAAEVEDVVSADFEAAWLMGQRYPDQDFSITDRTSFAVMQRLQILDVATFDIHFAIYRFGGNRSGAFRLHN